MKTLRIVISFVIGLAIGIVFHYTLYRMGLPIQPFIYLAF